MYSTPRAVSNSYPQLNIVHGNLRIVSFFLPRPSVTLTFVQMNIFIDSGGRARIAGLGAALLPSIIPGVTYTGSSMGQLRNWLILNASG